MITKILLTSDLHFSDKPKDAYRFDIFSFLKSKANKYKVDGIFILGDLTEKKDRHSSKLVNRIVDELEMLVVETEALIYILRGNHDGIDEKSPFFKFLNKITGVHFIHEQDMVHINNQNFLMIPHTRNDKFKIDKDLILEEKPNYIMLHQTVDGAISESGAKLTGLSTKPLDRLKPKLIFSGDIHKPQQAGSVIYIGAPYNIRFGDDFEPRMILLYADSTKYTNLRFQCPRKYSLTIREAEQLEELDYLKEGDQVKINLELTKEEFVEWPVHKRKVIDFCKKNNLELYEVKLLSNKPKKRKQTEVIEPLPVNNKESFLAFCKRERLSKDLRKIGLEIMEDDNV